MKISLCNEVLKDLDFSQQCRYAAQLGYEGLEVAPFTLSEAPHQLAGEDRRRIRRDAESAGLRIVGLHWLLVAPPGLSITSPDSELRRRTEQVLLGLVDLCAELGGEVMVHGSPQQRTIPPGERPSEAWKRSLEIFRSVARRAESAGVSYCLEPLAPAETDFINCIEEAVQMVRAVASPAFKTMLDTKAAFNAEEESPEQLLARWLPSGLIGHIHLNTAEGRAPGQDATEFGPVMRSLRKHGYSGWISVEPFEFIPGPRATAAQAFGYLRGISER